MFSEVPVSAVLMRVRLVGRGWIGDRSVWVRACSSGEKGSEFEEVESWDVLLSMLGDVMALVAISLVS